MARQTKLISVSQISDINLTPLMDLTFILLITFIITFPMIEQGIPINLPQGKAEELDPEQMRTITLDLAGKIFLDDLPTDEDALNAQMSQISESGAEVTVMVRADEGLAYKRVMEIMKILHGAKITRVALVTQAEGPPTQ